MGSFVPLTTFSGLPFNSLGSLVSNRNIILWGGGFLGTVLKRSFERFGLRVSAFCDKNPRFSSILIEGIPVISVKEALENAKAEKAFLVIASSRHRLEMKDHCLAAGLIEGNHFIVPLGDWEKNPRLQAKTLVCLRYGAL